MKYTKLPQSNIQVSKICLGSMTWGQQNTESEGHAQIEYALDQGVNFIDTAEMYSIPSRKETQGSTEKIIGSWFKKTGNRDKVVLATKVAGPNPSMSYIRPKLGFSKEALNEAVNKSLDRLQTDYIDLYQLHWPERNSNFFGQRGYKREKDDAWEDNFHEILVNLDELIKEGKIRKIGLSNETPYGVMRCVEESRKGLPAISTVQNPYSLLNRKDEIGLTEIYHREDIGLLPYSPLGMGTLSGKYLKGTPSNTRLELFPQYKRYSNNKAIEATEKYLQIAEKHGLSLTQMALAFIEKQAFVTSTIIGATTMDQLKENISSIHVDLSEEIMNEIEAVQELIPNPAP